MNRKRGSSKQFDREKIRIDSSRFSGSSIKTVHRWSKKEKKKNGFSSLSSRQADSASQMPV